jgi:poly-gamma-glutamate capsule biosynthesis protein CapA/YwtB (metallophosphatase superfamily)
MKTLPMSKITMFAFVVLIITVIAAPHSLLRGQGAAQGDSVAQLVRHDPSRELAMKITQPFTFAAVGDIIIRRPVGEGDAGYQALAKVMREADMTYANMEGPILDEAKFRGPLAGGPKSVVNELKRMGVRIMTDANNHTLDAGLEGMFETHRLLDEAGIVHAGSGKNLADARQARIAVTPKGTVAAIGMYSIDPSSNNRSRFTDATENMPGLNPLHVTPYNVVTAEHMQALKKIRDAIYARRPEVHVPVAPVAADEPAGRLRLFQTAFTVGPHPGDLTYEMDPADLKGIITSVRVGKQLADFLVVAIHCHQNSFAFQAYSQDHSTPNFLIELAHQVIDNGADAFVGHGVHNLRGVEIYKGKPIFYGVSSFFYHRGAAPEITSLSAGAGAGVNELEDNLETLLTTSRFEDGKLVEVRLYPADLGQDRTRPISRSGTPSTPSPEMARRVLERLQVLSKQFGTTISIENGVGVIRIASKQSN